MKENLQKGFTLIELLIVIAIVGLLAAALITNMTSGIAGGQKLKCMANLKNLAQAVSSYTTSQSGDDDDQHIPTAGSFETSYLASDLETVYFYSSAAWVSWTPAGGGDWPYKPGLTESKEDSMNASTFADTTPAFFSITNGVLWSYVGGDASVYFCGTHKKVLEATQVKRVYRSYVMNSYFGYHDKPNKPNYKHHHHRKLGSINQSGTAAIRVLFAELPGQKDQEGVFTGETWGDSVLDPGDSNLAPNTSKDEYFGFNHRVSNRWVANVAFADGHVDGVVQPAVRGSDGKAKVDVADLINLTKQMCNGEEIAIDIRKKMM